MKLISIDNLKTYLDFEELNVKYDDLLLLIIEGMSSRFETYCNRYLKKEERTELFDGGKQFYPLRAFPLDINQTLEVKVNDTLQTKDTDFYVKASAGFIKFYQDTLNTTPYNISIKWTGGYNETESVLSVPDDFKRACLMQCTFEFKRRNEIGLSAVSLKNGNVQVYKTGELLTEVKEILNIHRFLSL